MYLILTGLMALLGIPVVVLLLDLTVLEPRRLRSAVERKRRTASIIADAAKAVAPAGADATTDR